ncbi:cytochrome C oxidase subunit IV family protein [Halomonas piscis]|uniref:Cytochrome C oxidase subunit IV family protein n=1 Tax=Halomonas piscis TaxID=3031727 RepID=A0ABY9YY98_9GAMM|nr:cytochrome C oxidase subunit IV family protein [Halomonas piscis]WNK19802.1 cytochrome C oxidase subunit IV family protein [Halomonas piscis]
MATLPGKRHLLITWGVLIALTVVSMVSARLDQDGWQALPLWSAALVVLVTGFKAQQILLVYLNLRQSTGAWKGAFIGIITLTLLLISAGYLYARLVV